MQLRKAHKGTACGSREGALHTTASHSMTPVVCLKGLSLGERGRGPHYTEHRDGHTHCVGFNAPVFNLHDNSVRCCLCLTQVGSQWPAS